MLQTVATDEMRGRMQGVFIVVVAGGPRLADLWHGSAAAGVGPGAAATVGGFAVIVGRSWWCGVPGVLALPRRPIGQPNLTLRSPTVHDGIAESW